MKKLTFLLLSLVVVCSYGQVSINENFDGGTSLPSGWTETGGKTISSTDACAGNSIRDNLYGSSTSGTLTTPNQVSASNGTDLTVDFDYKIEDWNSTDATLPGWGTIDVQYSTDDGSNWNTFFTIDDLNHVTANTCASISETVLAANVPNGSDVKIQFLFTWASGDFDIYIDNFSATQAAVSPPNCDSSLTSATTDFAIDGDLTWSAATGGPTGYKISVGSSMGGTDIANNVDVGLTTTYTPVGLSYSTTYYTTITPYNANGDATGCTEESFAVEAAPPAGTDCNIPIDASVLPYTAIGATTSGFGDDYSGSAGASGCGSTSPYLNGDDIVYSHTASADGSIDIILTNITDNYTGVFVFNDCADIGTVCAAGDVNGFSTADLEILNFPVTNGSTYYIVVSTWATPQTTAYDLSITAGATCFDVTGLNLDSVSASSATISWTAAGSETAWEIAVQPDGTGTPGTADGDGTDTTSNPYTESGLSSNTAYEVYVRAECTAGSDFGDWVGPLDFTTACSALTPDYTADMSTNVPDACWDEAGSGAPGVGPGGVGSSDWETGSYAIGDSNKVNLYSDTDEEWLLSPSFDLSADGYELIVNVAVTDWNDGFTADTMGSDDEVQLLMSTDGGTTWTNLTTWNVGNQPALGGTEYVEDLTGTTGTDVRFAIWATDSATDDTEDYDFHVGQFIVRTPPPCPDVSAIAVSNISATGADVEWTNGGSETDWEVAVQAQGTGTPGGSGDATTSNPYSASGLTAQTDYEVYVRSDCGGGQLGNWIGPVNFTTACSTFSLPLVEGFESGVPPACWDSFRGANDLGPTYDWTSSVTSNSGSGAAFVRYSIGDGAAEDWLVTPAMDFSGSTNPELSFYGRDQFGTDYGSTYTIRVSTTDTDYASFTTVETYTEADQATTYGHFTVDLSAYAGQSTVYVAFVLENDDGDGWYVDDVVIYDNVPTTFTYTSGSWAPFNPMGIASSDDDIVIAAGDYVLDADMSCDRMDVLAGASITVDTGATLTLNDLLQLQSSSTSYSSLILDGTISGPIGYDRHVNINGSGSTGSNDLISAPLTGQAFSVVAAGNPNILNNGTLYLFGPFDKTTGQYVTWAGTESATLDAGVGYRAATSDGSVVSFGGTAENGTIPTTIENSGPIRQEWNLIGNPYPSYLNVQDFLNHDLGGGVTNIDLFDTPTAAIYGYDGSALNGWTIYNLGTTTASTVIAPGQGFFVSSLNPSSTIEFTAAMRSTGNSDDFIVGRNTELTYVKLKANSNNDAYITDIYFNNNASLGFDYGYDAALWGDSVPEFALYSHLVQENTGLPMAVQIVGMTDLSDVVIPLGVNANQGEELTFSIDEMNLPPSVNVYLEDMVENTVTLLNTGDYVITPTSDLAGTGRFFLRTADDALSTIDNSLDQLNIFALNSSKELVVSGQLQKNASLELYDIQGRKVISTLLDSNVIENRIDASALSAGVYIVTVENNGQQKTQKVILK